MEAGLTKFASLLPRPAKEGKRSFAGTQETGSMETFLKLSEANRILSNPELRAQYDARYRETKQLHWKIFDRAEAVKGPEAEQRKRHGILELLYAKTSKTPKGPR
jgi:hypothetical protein